MDDIIAGELGDEEWFASVVCYTTYAMDIRIILTMIYTIYVYLSLFTKIADPNPFRGTLGTH